MNVAESIPRYGLYGEKLSAGSDEIVHCETIEARSRLYRWEISAHRHPALSQVLFLASGQAEVLLGEKRSGRIGPLLVIAPTGVIHGFRFSEGALGLVLTLSPQFLARMEQGDPLAGHLALPRIVPLERAGRRRLLALGRQLLDARPEAGRADPLLQRALAEAWLRTATAPLALPPAEIGASARLRDFRMLVERHFREHRPLTYYAEELRCTERTLARLTQGAWGMTPAQFIHRRIADEARRLLRFTNAGCGAIAAELGFEDPSYFSRFYLRMTGRRPSRERSGEAPKGT